MINKLLIANRGEIACRVIRTAQRLGIATVAVYSDADRTALHVRSADEAFHIGPAPARDSYLRGQAIIDVAMRAGADAIHPGYGFLSENAEFAKLCAEHAMVFVGPGPDAIDAMGSKANAKTIMADAGVPLIPGYHGDDQSAATLRAEADAMGYPVLLKATAGGGGKGMRQVHSADEFDDALASAKREALASFGNDDMLVEKYLQQPRHVEVQVFCDSHGNGVYLAERDCSLQRRHQKVIEEAPAPGLDKALRERMGNAAVTAARAINYCGAGTIEFLLDTDGRFYFMEMNTRLQVEHPVTEMITGQDLVEWQLRVAAGEPLPLQQDDVVTRGHAFEARVYAEDPGNDFLPATGTLHHLQAPVESTHVRVDTGVCEGDEISVHYDPMIAKLIVWDENRDRALRRLADNLRHYRVGGTVTNLDFLYNLATCAPFQAEDLDTRFIERHHALIFHTDDADIHKDLPLAALALLHHRRKKLTHEQAGDPHSPWQKNDGWRMNLPVVHHLQLRYGDHDYPMSIEQDDAQYRVTLDGQTSDIQLESHAGSLVFTVSGHRRRASLVRTDDHYTFFSQQGALTFKEVMPDTGEQDDTAGDNALCAPMNGTIVALLAEPGDQLEKDTPVLLMEAMKMEHTIRAPADGTVGQFFFQPGDLVDGGSILLDFTANADDES